jgi:ABC-2 type transport system ATP-binding protein
MRSAIRTTNLGKVYRQGFFMRRVEGLSDLNIEVPEGAAFGFIGPNGAGKTTTLKILMGLHAATTGEAWVLGQPVDQAGSRERVGFLPERPYFYAHLTARELLGFYGKLYKMDRSTVAQRTKRLLEQVGMDRFANEKLGKYSKGMLQRVGLCQALLNDPDLLVLDEPMSGLDPLGRAMVRDLILEQRAKGKTIFFSSHILSDVESICDQVAILVGGKLRGVGTVKDLIGNRVSAVELVATGIAQPPEGTVLIRSDERRMRLRVAPDAADGAVASIQAAGGKIVERIEVRADLESVLVDEMAGAHLVGGEVGQ